MADTTTAPQKKPARSQFSSQTMFIAAAIGSAVGLGNIWRFPYVAYENGAGAFLIPYVVALLTAGIPILYLDYVIGHRMRASAPLSMRRISKYGEWIGWWMLIVCVCIALYYAAILGWATNYTAFAFTKAWGTDPNAFFFQEFLQTPDEVTLSFVTRPQIVYAMVLVWALILFVLGLGVSKGIGRVNLIAMPLLAIMFTILVVRSLFLEGAMDGLNAFFTPDWQALASPGVWTAAYGQIFFSLSVGFGIMMTYASYMGKDEDMTGPGAVAAFANSSFELLAGIGVFAVLGFMANVQGKEIGEVVTSGIGLAFVAFPAIINEAPGGEIIGVLFFGSLVVAGFTSLLSIMEVVINGISEKVGWSRNLTLLIVGLPCAFVSCAAFGTTTGLYVLDVVDAFVNNYGIVGGAIFTCVAAAWAFRRLPEFRAHLNTNGSIKIGRWWEFLIAFITPIVLIWLTIESVIANVGEVYGGYPTFFVGMFGWGLLAVIFFSSVFLSVDWPPETQLDYDDDTMDISDELQGQTSVGILATAEISEQLADTTGPTTS